MQRPPWRRAPNLGLSMVWKTSRAPKEPPPIDIIKWIKYLGTAGLVGCFAGAWLTLELQRRFRRRRYRTLGSGKDSSLRVRDLLSIERTQSGANGGFRVLASPELRWTTGVQLRLVRIELPANTRTQELLVDQGVVLYLVLSGKGIILKGDDNVECVANDTVYVAPHTRHAVINRSASTLVVLQVVDPAPGVPQPRRDLIVELEESERGAYSVFRSIHAAAQDFLDPDREA